MELSSTLYLIKSWTQCELLPSVNLCFELVTKVEEFLVRRSEDDQLANVVKHSGSDPSAGGDSLDLNLHTLVAALLRA